MGGTWRVRGYHLERLLGRGASSEVWRARVTGSGDEVALKRLGIGGREQAARAHAEAALLTVLDHPNLVRLHALVPADGAAVLVLDLADGGSLAELLGARGRITPGETITALAPVAAALAYLHGHEVVHGDVSAANVLFTRGGVPLLADLGVARLSGDDRDAESTPAYVDPAVAAGCVPSSASDVFMLAAVAMHALTGSPPWPGDTDAALAAARVGLIADPGGRMRAAGVPADLADVVARALSPEPRLRGSAADFALDLRHSGTPVAVELSAGRERAIPSTSVARHREGGRLGDDYPEPPGHGQTSPRIGRHAAISAPVAREAPELRAISAPAHPSRPVGGPVRDGMDDGGASDASDASGLSLAGAPPPTHAIRRPRPVIPRPAPRRVRRRRLVAVVLAASVLLGAGAAVAWWPSAADPPGRDVAPRAGSEPGQSSRVTGPAPKLAPKSAPDSSPRSTPTSAVRSATRVPPPARTRPDTRAGTSIAASPATPTPTPRAATGLDAGWARTLRALDDRRSRAFATRDAQLLRAVYVAGPLLSADEATLRRLVPAGCRLVGAVTRFADVHAHRAAGGVEVRSRVSLAASTLRCAGRGPRRLDGAGPSRMTLRLVRVDGGMRIAAQQIS